MEISADRFLAITALLASTTLAGGCSENVDTKTDGDSGVAGVGGGSGGSGGGTAGSGGGGQGGEAGSAGSGGGTAGAGGSTGGAAGTGGASGAAGAAGTAGTGGAGDAGQECLGDATPEAGASDCLDLSYATTLCGSDPDAGVEGLPPLGFLFCDYVAQNGRSEVFEATHECLSNISVSDDCGTDHDTAVQACIDTVLPQACDAPPPTIGDAGMVGCAEIAASCPADADAGIAGIDEQTCRDSLDAFNDAARATIVQCYNDSGLLADGGVSMTACDEDFTACVFNF